MYLRQNLTDKLSLGHTASISSVIQAQNSSKDTIGMFSIMYYVVSATRKDKKGCLLAHLAQKQRILGPP